LEACDEGLLAGFLSQAKLNTGIVRDMAHAASIGLQSHWASCENRLSHADRWLTSALRIQAIDGIFVTRMQFPVMLSGHRLQFAGLDIVDKASDVDALRNERRIAQEGDVVAHGLFQVLEGEEGDVVCVSR